MSGTTLEQRMKHPAFTPGRKDFAQLLSILAETDAFDQVAKLLLRAGAAAFQDMVLFLNGPARHLPARRRAEFVRLLVSVYAAPRTSPKDVPDEEQLADVLLAHVSEDLDPIIRRWSVLGAGRVAWTTARSRMVSILEHALRAQMQPTFGDQPPDLSLVRALAESLGKLGAVSSIDLLKTLSFQDEPTRKVLETALLRLQRDAVRGERQGVRWLDQKEVFRRGETSPTSAAQLVFRCREGLEDLLAEEIQSVWGGGARVISRGLVAPLQPISLSAALKIRCAEDFACLLPPAANHAASLSTRVRSALEDVALALQEGPSSWAVRFLSGRSRRGVVLELARAVSSDALINDSRSPLWEIEVDDRGTVHEQESLQNFAGTLLLRPSGYLRDFDRRFAWRQNTVAASSHAPLAAAIARLGGVREGDVVWDPFCGAGAELIERALLGPVAKIVGTDTSPGALDAARDNAARAGVQIAWLRADATHPPQSDVAGVTLVLSNPPLGKRVARRQEGELLTQFARVLPRVLAPHARVVLVVPPGLHDFHIEGLAKSRQYRVDLGGFDASLQLWVR